MFALGIEFLTGNAVMTAAATREEAEWPPHPARVFMAMVAAHYETAPLADDGRDAAESWADEHRALEWLEEQNPPAIQFRSIPLTQRRTVLKVYVPVNDAGLPANPNTVPAQGLRSAMGVMPAHRSRQDRTFPTVHVGWNAPECYVHLIWADAELPVAFQQPMERLAAKVIRIGHSSSLTRMWVAAANAVPQPSLVPDHLGSGRRASHSLRSMTPALLSELERRFNAGEIETFFTLREQIQTAAGAAKRTAQKKFEEHFGEPFKRNSSHPVRLRPSAGIARGYISAEQPGIEIGETVFDSELLILTKQEGCVLGLESTNLLTELLRGALLSGSESAPEWFTGHQPAGQPSERPHMAILPLAYVGAEHADGHILGMALAFPRNVPDEEKALQLRHALFDERGLEREITLRTNSLGEWKLSRESRANPPLALRSSTWTNPSSVWASVTPVVLDRHPKSDPGADRTAWRKEVAESIADSCQRIGLPRPLSVDIDKTSWHRGAPRSRPGPSGMPWLPSKSGSARQQVHIHLEFGSAVRGPVILGAGRYRGYGLCKPLAQ